MSKRKASSPIGEESNLSSLNDLSMVRECRVILKKIKTETESTEDGVASGTAVSKRQSVTEEVLPMRGAVAKLAKKGVSSKAKNGAKSGKACATTEEARGAKCKWCHQYLNDPDLKLFSGDSDDAVDELIMLTDERLSLYSGQESESIQNDYEDRPQHKIDKFSIYCNDGHLCCFDGGLLERKVKLWVSGIVRPIYAEENDNLPGVNTKRIGPLLEWWSSGFDGGENAILGITTEYCDLILMRSKKEYKSFTEEAMLKIHLSKFVIEFALENEEASFDDLLNSIQSAKKPPGVESIIQDDLLTHAQFITEQVASFDEDGGDGEEALLSSRCLRGLIKIAGVQLPKGLQPKRHLKKNAIKKSKGKTTDCNATTTTLVHNILKSAFGEKVELHKTGQIGKIEQKCGRCAGCKRKATCLKPRFPEKGVPVIELSDDDEEDCEDAMDRVARTKSGTDKDAKTRISKSMKNVVKWIGAPIQKNPEYTYYDSAQVNDDKVSRGDSVLVKSENKTPFVARVVNLFQNSKGEKMFHALWFMRGVDTILGDTSDERELFLADDCGNASLCAIVAKTEVREHKPERDWAFNGGIDNPDVDQIINQTKDSFFYQKWYDPDRARFEDPPKLLPEDEDEADDVTFCLSCARGERVVKETNPQLGEKIGTSRDDVLYKSLTWRRETYLLGSCVMVDPDVIPLKIYHSFDSKGKKLKSKVDETRFPEYYRKNDSDYMRGNNGDVPDPLVIGRIVQIYTDNSPFRKRSEKISLRLQVFYRPENTSISEEEVYAADFNKLYWTADEKTIKLSGVQGVCHAVYKGHIEGSLEEFRLGGPRRFYYEEGFDKANESFFEISPTLKNMSRRASSDIPVYPEPKKKLKTLDIFAGCGGLSEGFHQAGFCETVWAIENYEAAAEAFQLNNKKCTVFTQDCNLLLKEAMAGCDTNKLGQKLPKKGEVDIICGGPPCQGFSGMNRFNDGQYSMFKNSLIATFLSYCDFFRPRFFVLENVRNFVSYKKSMVLKLVFRCLIRMGYQCTFVVLQAGNFGVPQTRRRVIILAAAPGEVLPQYPEPIHVFSSRACQLSVVVDEKKYTPTDRGIKSAMYRRVTVRDSLGDLPSISNGAKVDVLKYPGSPMTHFQRMMRGESKHLKDHVCKEMNQLVQARLKLIPLLPGSDWRDLPNISVKLDSGEYSKVLKYRYHDQVKGKAPNGNFRGVCPCATGKACDPDAKQTNTIIPWCLPHTSNRHNNWAGLYGRLSWYGYFCTTVTNPEPMGKQGCVVHPEQDRVVSVRECARSQGFPDGYKFAGTILERHMQVGNAVPPPLARSIGFEIRLAVTEKEKRDC